MGLIHCGTGTQLAWYTLGLVHNDTGRDTMEQGDNGLGTQWDSRDVMGPVHSGTQWYTMVQGHNGPGTHKLVNWCFEPSQLLGIISGLKDFS